MSSYANEAGEPFMTAAQLNFEAALDADAAHDAWYDDDLFIMNANEADDYANENEFPEDGDWYGSGEDAWLDGSYEN